MMHSHLPSPRPLALPSIGFAQNIWVGPEMLGRHYCVISVGSVLAVGRNRDIATDVR
jgi:hypothetical protein